MTPCFHVRHVLLMPATCDCAWLLTMPIVATMRGHRSLALLDRSRHDPLEPCAPDEFRVSKAWVVLPLLLFCRYCCNSDGRFATLFEICGYDCCDSSIEICLARQRIYLVLRRGCWGWARNPGSWLFWTADTWPVTFNVGKVWLAVTNPGCGGGRAVGTTTTGLSAPQKFFIEVHEVIRRRRGPPAHSRLVSIGFWYYKHIVP